jgi:glyoxylase-like metal-dependent hydrolase (beta-lactamase superfamily II)
VKVRAEPLALTEPLPGGRADATVVVEPIEAGRARFPPEYFECEARGPLRGLKALGVRVPKDEWADVPVPAFLVRHPEVGAILIDTGLHPSVASDPRHNMGRRAAGYFDLEAGRDVPAQLREKGLDAGEIAVVVLTHLHLDHASAISEFGESTFVVSSREWEAATSPRIPLLAGYRPAHYDHAFDWCTVDFEADLISSYGPFGRTFDLFGDGSVRLAFTPGHTLGHQSVILRLPRRDFVVGGDVAFTWRQLQGGPEPYRPADRHSWRRSLKELQAYHRAYPYAVILPGHDQALWEKLEDRYAE